MPAKKKPAGKKPAGDEGPDVTVDNFWKAYKKNCVALNCDVNKRL